MKNNIFSQLLICIVTVISLSNLALAANNALEIDIQTQSNEPLQQLTIPEYFYLQGKSNNLSHITITDKFGTSLPYQISKYSREIQHQKRAVKIYALKESRYLQRQTDNISLKYDSKNRLTEVHRNNGGNGIESAEIVMGYILDLGERYPREDSRLTFELSPVTDTSFLKFTIDKSTNLRNWRRVPTSEVIAQLVNQGIVTQHNSLSLKNVRSRYVRLTILDDNPQFRIYSAVQDFDRLTTSPLAWTTSKKMKFDQKQQAFVLNISPNLNYRRFQIQMPVAPSIITGSLSYRANSKSRWRRSNHLNFINIENENTKILEHESSIWTRQTQQLKLEISYSLPHINKDPLWVKLAYEPQKITFFANGNGPYKMRVDNKVNNHNNPQLLKTIKKQSGNAIGMATLGHFRSLEIDLKSSTINWRKILLWVVLIVGVILMAWMAKQLLKKID